MKKFEYLTVEITVNAPKPDERWMQLGTAGWELVTAQIMQGEVNGLSPMEISVIKSRLIFKREIVS